MTSYWIGLCIVLVSEIVWAIFSCRKYDRATKKALWKMLIKDINNIKCVRDKNYFFHGFKYGKYDVVLKRDYNDIPLGYLMFEGNEVLPRNYKFQHKLGKKLVKLSFMD